jgi:hypothetical protein
VRELSEKLGYPLKPSYSGYKSVDGRARIYGHRLSFDFLRATRSSARSDSKERFDVTLGAHHIGARSRNRQGNCLIAQVSSGR